MICPKAKNKMSESDVDAIEEIEQTLMVQVDSDAAPVTSENQLTRQTENNETAVNQ